MSSIDRLNQLYDGILSQIKTLETKNEQLVLKLKVQEILFARQIAKFEPELQLKEEEIKRLKNGGTTSIKLGPPPRLPFTPVSTIVPPSKKRKIVVKQEQRDDDDFIAQHPHANAPLEGPRVSQLLQDLQPEPLAESLSPTMSSPTRVPAQAYQEHSNQLLHSHSNQYQEPTGATSYLAKFSLPRKSQLDLDLKLLQKSSPSQQFAEDSEFARLPTQYSEVSNSPVKSTQLGINLSPIKCNQLGTSPIRRETDLGIPSSSYSDPENEVVDDSDEEFDLLRTPLIDITNTRSKLTPLQARDLRRKELQEKFDHEPGFQIDLGPDSKHPIYQQSWMISDFEPNQKHVKQKLKRKVGKTRKEQQEIDRFYTLAGPGIHLKSIRWGEDDKENEKGAYKDMKAPEISQLYDRFPSPPGFNEVDFPTTQEERERRLHSERVQSARIQSRLTEALKSGSHVFREKLLNDYIQAGRFTT